MFRLFVSLVSALILAQSMARAESLASDKVALVIGMSQYTSISSLKNTSNDANALALTLQDIGFDVDVLIDGTRDQVIQSLQDFTFRSETADLALIYFAGHGVSVQGTTFLIPVDATIRQSQDIVTKAVTMDMMLAAVDGARKMRILILDSCRDNPFPDVIDLNDPEVAKGLTTGKGGLAAPSPERGTLVAFAARDGEVAFDGGNGNSPFNIALRDNLVEEGLEISLMFRQVRDDVLAMTDNAQEPATYGSLPGVPFYIVDGGAAEKAPSVADLAAEWSRIAPDEEEQLLALAESGDTRSMFGVAFSMLYPESDRYDPVKAASLLERAADAGSPEAQFQLAKLYERGIGVAEDHARAIALYQAAADQDFPDAVNEMGFFHFTGALGVSVDQARALEFFRKAADLGQTEAMFNVASFADDGLAEGLGPEDAAGYLYRALRGGSKQVLDALTDKSDSFSPDTWMALQTILAENGLYEGEPDGEFGPGTRRSIRAAFGILDAEN